MANTESRSVGKSAAWCLAIVALAGLSVVSSGPSAAATPPARRTYFTISVGLDSPYSWQAECLRFSKNDICTSDRACGSWVRTEAGPAGSLAYEIELEEDGVPIRIDAQARIETRGKQDTIGGAARVEMRGEVFNFSFTGRSTKPRKCRRLLQQWEASDSPAPVSALAVGRPEGR